MKLLYSLLLACTSVIGINAAITCNTTSPCPLDTPCCSQYGECGTGAYCLGGCDIRSSFNLTSCMPRPVCQSKTTNFNNVDDLVSIDNYLGNSSSADWMYSGYVLNYTDSIILAMPNHSAGTVLSSTDYVWYGKVTAELKTSHLQGVVTAFILFSDVEDEIDYEFVGADLYKAQTNFYALGVTNYTNSRNITTDNSTYDDYHTYEFDWQEDQITWSVDGVVGRTLKKADTYNATSNKYMYPQTPARVEVSIWPAGDASNAIGTIDWAGGLIDWNVPEVTGSPGYYSAILKSISIDCYDVPSEAAVFGSKAYVYNSTDGGADNVMLTDDSTILGSFEAVGFDVSLGASSSSSSASSSSSSKSSSSGSSNSGSSTKSSSSSTTSSAPSVPTGAGAGQTFNGDSTSDSATTASSSTSTNTQTGFVQSSPKSSGSSTSSSSGAGQIPIVNYFFSALSLLVSFLI